MQQCVAGLQSAELLYQTQLFPDVEYTFKHALTHEVAYGSLLHGQRRTLHGRVVDAIERLSRERLSEHVDRLAHHAFRAERWETATRYLRQAGTRALDRSANTEAALVLEQALGALGQLPHTRERAEETIDVRLDLRNAVWPLGRLDLAYKSLTEAMALAEALRDQRRLGHVLPLTAAYFCMIGDPERAIAAADRALSIAATLADLPSRAATTARLGWAHLGMGDYRRGASILEGNIAELEGSADGVVFGALGQPAVDSRMWLVWCFAELGDFAQALQRAQEALRIAESVDRPFPILQSLMVRGLVHLRRGDLSLAVSVLERGLDLSRASGFRALAFHGVAAFLGAAYAWSGRLAEAVSLLEPVEAQTAAMGTVFDEVITRLSLGEA